MRARLSILDLAPIARGETASDSFGKSVALARRAEELGYERVWYAEHHNIAGIASSATSVLIAHIGARTTKIRLGAGGVMLPNHAPLMIAEQFGTLAAMYPGRIDLGLGRAPGSDQNTPSRGRDRTSRCTSWDHRCSARSWPRRWACRTPSRPTSRRRRSTPRSPCTAPSSSRARSWSSRT